MFGEQFDYLRLCKNDAESVKHPDSYIMSGDKQNAVRRIFKKVYYDKFEIEQLHQMLQILNRERIYLNQVTDTFDVIFRFLYANNFDLELTLDQFARYLIWFREMLKYLCGSNNIIKISDKYRELYENGVMYFSGRDKMLRPTLVLNVHRIPIQNFDPDLIGQSLSILCLMMQEYFFYDGKVENWNLFVETQQRCLVDIQLPYIKSIIQLMQRNFPQTLERVFIFSPSLSLQLSWSLIEGMINKQTRNKLMLIKSESQKSDLLMYYNNSQLEERFGGTMQNIVKYWPPLNTLPDAEQYVEIVQEEKDPDEELNKRITNYFNVDEQLHEIGKEIEQNERRESQQKYEKVNDDQYKKYLKDWAQQEKYETVLPYKKLKQTQGISLRQYQSMNKQKDTKITQTKEQVEKEQQFRESKMSILSTEKKDSKRPTITDDYNACLIF